MAEDPYMKKVKQDTKDRYMKQRLLDEQWAKEDKDHTNCEHYLSGICMIRKDTTEGINKCSVYKKRGRK